MLEEEIRTTLTLSCDGPARGVQCRTPPLVTNTEAALLKAMRGAGWRLPDLDGDGKIDRAAPCYCKGCDAALTGPDGKPL